MADHDVFNGDADGICALHQLQRADPRDTVLVTGAKRDIALLARVDAGAGDRLRVLDVSLARNRAALDRLLAAGASIDYYDHHEPGAIPSHARLHASIDTAPDACTAIIVDRLLSGRWRRWAIVAAFGDGLPVSATALARRLPADAALDDAALGRLRRLGEAINYNAYAADTGTAPIPPEALYRSLDGVDDPLPVSTRSDFAHLGRMIDDDLHACLDARPLLDTPGCIVRLLPDSPAGRRARGLVAHRLREAEPHRATAVVAPDGKGLLDVSLRCTPRAGVGASAFAARFGGGGRATAAGIDDLPAERLDELLAAMRDAFGDAAPGGQRRGVHSTAGGTTPMNTPDTRKPVDVDEAKSLLDALEHDLRTTGLDPARTETLLAELDRLRVVLDADDRADHEVHTGLHGMRERLHHLSDELIGDAFQAGRYLSEIGRILGLG
ncbi:MAG: DHHA1 domain-containing protein [Lautropia sp.]